MKGTSLPFQMGRITVVPPFALVAGATLVIPIGRVLVAMRADDAVDFDKLQLQLSTDGGTTWVSMGNWCAGDTVGLQCLPVDLIWYLGAILLVSDGVNLRLTAVGGDIAIIQYAYFDVS